MDDLISKKAAIDALIRWYGGEPSDIDDFRRIIEELPSAQPKNYTELKKELIRMASYIYVFLECSDEQRETLIGFVSRLADFISWTERD